MIKNLTQSVKSDMIVPRFDGCEKIHNLPTTDQAKLERMIRHALTILRERQPAAPQTNEVRS